MAAATGASLRELMERMGQGELILPQTRRTRAVTWSFRLERAKGIEPS